MDTDFEEIHGFPQDYHSGHFLFIAPTGGGKSYYAKWLVANLALNAPLLPCGRPAVYVYAGAHVVDDWQQVEADGRRLAPLEHVMDKWDVDQFKEILAENIHAKNGKARGVMVFDDFKTALNFHADPEFKNLPRMLRHVGIQAVFLSHALGDTPPVLRENVTHVLLGASSSAKLMKEYAGLFLAGDTSRLQAAYSRMRPYSFIKINVRACTITIHSAPPPSETGVHTSSIGIEGGGSASINPVNNITQQAKTVNGVYNDASRNYNSLVLNTSNQVKMEDHRVQMQINRERVVMERKMQLESVMHQSKVKSLENRLELRDLLMSTFLDAESRDRAAKLLAIQLSDTSITGYNMFTGGKDIAFMRTHFPDTNYQGHTREAAAITTLAPVAMALAKQDGAAILGEVIKAGGSGFFKKGLSLLGYGQREDAAPTPSAVAREKARALIVFRDNREKGYQIPPASLVAALRGCVSKPQNITTQTALPTAFKMLQKYYPDDYTAEVEIAENWVCRLITRRKNPEKGYSGVDLPQLQLALRCLGRGCDNAEACLRAALALVREISPEGWAREEKLLRSSVDKLDI